MVLPADPLAYLIPLSLLTLVVSFVQIRRNEADLARKKREIDQRLYETLVLREVGERIGYELNLDRILEIVVSSLDKLFPFSVAAYLLINRATNKPELRFFLREPVNRAFLDNLRGRILAGLGPAGQGIEKSLKETLAGTIVDEASPGGIVSLWTAPLSLGGESAGVLVVASREKGLYQGPEMEVLNKILAQAHRAVHNLQQVLEQDQEKLRLMVASMADGVLMLDRELNLLVVNPAAAVLLGLNFEKKLTLFEIAEALADRIDLRTRIEESIQGNKLVAVDNLIAGDKVSRLLISPVTGKGREPLGTVIIFHDITAQKELERVREEFTAMMVHELRAPLTVVRGATDIILRNPPLAVQEQGQGLVKTMQNSAESMLSLVNDLLDVAKIEAGKFQVIKTMGNLAEVVNERIAFFNQLAAPKSLALAAEVATALPAAEFDRERMIQVFNNLLSNAIKFTPAGGRVIISGYKIASPAEIKWRFPEPPTVAPCGPAILIAISDTGGGIAPEKVADLFSKFKQLRPAEGDSKGTGLGLVIAKGIVESHGGQIFVQSRVNEGSTFYFTIPLTLP